MSLLTWLTRLVFGAVAPAVEEEVERAARDFMVTLQDDSKPVPLPSSAVARRTAMAAQAAHAFPPPCPPSLPPSGAPPKLSSVPPPPTGIPSHRVPPAPARSQSRPSSGPPPRLSSVPPPLRPADPPPTRESPPRPSRRR